MQRREIPMSPATPLRFRVERPLPEPDLPHDSPGPSLDGPGLVGYTVFDPAPVLLGVSPSQERSLSTGSRIRSARGCGAEHGRSRVPSLARAVFGDGEIAASAASGLDPVRCHPVAGGEETGDFSAREQQAMEALRLALIAG